MECKNQQNFDDYWKQRLRHLHDVAWEWECDSCKCPPWGLEPRAIALMELNECTGCKTWLCAVCYDPKIVCPHCKETKRAAARDCKRIRDKKAIAVKRAKSKP